MSAATSTKSSIDPSLRAPLEWFEQNSRGLLLGALAVAGAILAYYLLTRSGQIKAVRAEEAYNESQQLFYTGKSAEGAIKMAEAAKRYAGTNSGTMAGMRLAVFRISERKMGDALAVLREIEPKADQKIFGTAIHSLMAAALSDSGLYLPAAEEYVKSAQATEVKAERAALNYRAAEMFAQGGNKERAIEILRTLTGGPPTETSGKARKLIGELTTTPARVGSPG